MPKLTKRTIRYARRKSFSFITYERTDPTYGKAFLLKKK